MTYLSGPGVVPTNIAQSGFDVLGRSYLQNQVSQWYVNNQGFRDYIGGDVGLAANAFGKITGVSFTFNVHFADGTVGAFNIAGINGMTHAAVVNAQFKLELISMLDANGNQIPVSVTGFEGQTFLFESASAALAAFVAAADRMGGPFVRVDTYITTPQGTTTITDGLVCKMSGGKLNCEKPNNLPK